MDSIRYFGKYFYLVKTLTDSVSERTLFITKSPLDDIFRNLKGDFSFLLVH